MSADNIDLTKVDNILHVLRNPFGWNDYVVRDARLQAADEIERLRVDERRLTLLEMQVGALIKQREDYAARVQRLREFIKENCSHSSITANCLTCQFLQEDAR